MTDILLIQPPVEDFYFTYKRSIPYGLASIAASLQQQGFSVEILDCLAVRKSKIIQMPQEMDYLIPYYGEHDTSIFSLFHEFRHYGYSYEYVGKIVRDKKPFLVGISSLFTPYCHTAETTAHIVRKFCSNCKIVMGGHHPTVLPHEVMKCSAVDFILRGEGEISMPLLAKILTEGGNLEDVPGIVFRKHVFSLKKPDESHKVEWLEDYSTHSHDSLHISEPVWIEDFSSLPPPAMDLVNHNFYSRSSGEHLSKPATTESSPSLMPAKKCGSTVVVAGRGCPMSCTYCSVGASSSHGRFRQRKVKDVIYELSLQIEKYNIGFIDFEDENLTLNRQWFLDLMGGIVKLCDSSNLSSVNKTNRQSCGNEIDRRSGSRVIELRAMNGLYPPSLDEEMILAMKAAGFKTLNLSLGSTSESQLRRFRRPDVRYSFEQVLSIAERHNLQTVSYLIAGAPNQSAEDSLNDLLFLSQKKTLIGLSIFYPAPGSVDYEKCRKKGLLPYNFSLMRSSALPISHTTNRIQAVTLLRLARVVNFMKSLLSGNQPIPVPESYRGELCEGSNLAGNKSSDEDRSVQSCTRGTDDRKVSIDRRIAGITLLKWFLHDGVLRGSRSDGTVFAHNVDVALCRQFIKEILGMEISHPISKP